jgi:uncharacterized membrane protein HdeD (DUF308 family)
MILRGILAILVGLVTFAWPGITLVALVILFGAYALLDGALNIAGAWRAAEKHERWIPLLIGGLIGIAASIITVLWPAITALSLVFVIAAWSLMTGIFEIVAAVRLRKYISGEWLLALSGVASVIFGLLLALFPAAGALAIALWVGVYMFVAGVILIALGIRMRGYARELGYGGAPAHAHSR